MVETITTPDNLSMALDLAETGICTIPVHPANHPDESKRKRAKIIWKPYQETCPTVKELQQFPFGDSDIAIVCGSSSGNVEIIDCDAPEYWQPFLEGLRGHDEALADKVLKADTPSGGKHLIYRCEVPVPGNQKLAMSNTGKEVLFETRGQGGYALIEPSEGYTLHGSIWDIPVISKEERDLIVWLASTFNEHQKVDTITGSKGNGTDTRPGDVFNNKSDWEQILSEDGWQLCGNVGERTHYTRPGKKKGSTSATLHPEKGLYVFSTSTVLPSQTPLDKFGYLAHFRCGGDFRAAAKLVREMYSEEFPSVPVFADSSGLYGQNQTKSGHSPETSRVFAEEVRAYIERDTGPFTNKDLYSELCINTRREKKTVLDALYYYEKKNKISRIEGKRGHWEVVENEPQFMDLLSADETPINVPLPLDIGEHVMVRPGGVLLVSGSNNSGKTVFLLSIVRNFLPPHINSNPSFINKREEGLALRYLNSEMSKQELVARIRHFGDDPKDWVQSVEFIERTRAFDKLILPDGVNLIDYLEVPEDFFLAGKYISEIHHKLQSGIAIIAMQKKQGHDFAKGGEMTLEKPRLAINLDKNEPHGFICKITKAKEPVDYRHNIQGMEKDFVISKNSKILPLSNWRFVNEKLRKKINEEYTKSHLPQKVRDTGKHYEVLEGCCDGFIR